MRPFPVTLPSGARYWTVLDDDLAVVPAADAFLRDCRFGQDRAELTTKAYAGAVALYLRWCERTGRDWRSGVSDFGLFVAWLRYAAADGSAAVVAGPGARPARGARRINAVLAGVRGFLAHAVARRDAPSWVIGNLYELADDWMMPVEARGEDTGVAYRMKARHRVHAPAPAVDRATDDETVRLLRACLSARDRLIVLLMARAGLRRGEVTGLRRSDVHFVMDSRSLGCAGEGAHLHVVRRQNMNGAWAKSRYSRGVPADFLLVQAYDQYIDERLQCGEADSGDFLLVNLFRRPAGSPVTPAAVNELVTAAAVRAGLSRSVTPHMLRHAFASNIGDAGGAVDEIQTLLGHRQARSSEPYLHPDTARLRAAVDRVPSPRLLGAEL
jgi:integrase/recombinase XerD